MFLLRNKKNVTFALKKSAYLEISGSNPFIPEYLQCSLLSWMLKAEDLLRRYLVIILG